MRICRSIGGRAMLYRSVLHCALRNRAPIPRREDTTITCEIINESAAMVTNSVRLRRCCRYIAGLLCAYGSITGVGLAAGYETPPPQQVVRIGDLNLHDSRGVAVAYGRLLWAAERVCPFADSSDHWLRVSAAPCIIRAVSRAVDNIGSPQLSAYALSQPLFRLSQTQAIAHR
jgi:UrcA family protein